MPLYSKEIEISKSLYESLNASGRVLINLYVHEMLGTCPRGYVDIVQETDLVHGTVSLTIKSLLSENKLSADAYDERRAKPRKFRLKQAGIDEVEGFTKDREILHKYLKCKVVGLNEVEERITDTISKLQNLLKKYEGSEST